MSFKKIERLGSFMLGVIVLFVVGVLSPSCFAQSNTIMNTGTLRLWIGQTKVITLESNPTTGYSWQIDKSYNGKIIKILSHSYKPTENTKNLVGAGGIESWALKGKSAGTSEVVFEYVRPWENGIQPVKTYRATVVVSDKRFIER